MEDLNQELWKLGILAKTEHKEVAPGSTSWRWSIPTPTWPPTRTS